MNYRISLDQKGPVGRTEAAIRADRERFEKLVEVVPLNEVRDQVSSFLQGEVAKRLREVLSDPMAIGADFVAKADDADQEQFARELSALLQAGAQTENVDPDHLQAETEHVRRELLRHIVELARRAAKLGNGAPVIVDEHLVPQLEKRAADAWAADRDESLAELQGHLPLRDDAVSRMLDRTAAQLIRLASERVVELPGGIDLRRTADATCLSLRRAGDVAPSGE